MADCVPANAKRIAAGGDDIAGQRVMLLQPDLALGESNLYVPDAPHADIPLPILPPVATNSDGMKLVDALREQGAVVDELATYTIRPAVSDPVALSTLLAEGVDIVTFTCPFELAGLVSILNGRPVVDVLSSLTVACGDPATAGAAHALGIRVDVTPEEHTVEGLVEALAKWRRDTESPGGEAAGCTSRDIESSLRR